jgi:hypothetical protein
LYKSSCSWWPDLSLHSPPISPSPHSFPFSFSSSSPCCSTQARVRLMREWFCSKAFMIAVAPITPMSFSNTSIWQLEKETCCTEHVS